MHVIRSNGVGLATNQITYVFQGEFLGRYFAYPRATLSIPPTWTLNGQAVILGSGYTGIAAIGWGWNNRYRLALQKASNIADYSVTLAPLGDADFILVPETTNQLNVSLNPPSWMPGAPTDSCFLVAIDGN